ncbi:MAG: hypothetical protein IJB83_02505 [Bacilli bacterium]|nr:hypothetical protein [Bacilli bacterium]
MIATNDRSYYIGASDTKYVIGNWKTKTFENWWLEKLGIRKNHFQNKYTLAGTNYEHKILDFIDSEKKDLQVIKGRLRVNIDGFTKGKIQEVKTYNYEKGFNLSKDYINQCQIEMYAFDTTDCEIVAYGLEEKDYDNYFRNIDEKRLSKYQIEYDKDFVNITYLPRYNYLEKCLEKGSFPTEEEYETYRKN